MNDSVTITAKEIRNFFDTMDEQEKDIFFTILATGRTAEYARNYVFCIQAEKSAQRCNEAKEYVEDYLTDLNIERRN